MSTDTLFHRYQVMAASDDLRVRALAERQLARLQRGARPGNPDRVSDLSRWAHVPLLDLWATAGNVHYEVAGGRYESGHQPAHGSRSGRCVSIDPTKAMWFCRSCRIGGGVVAAVVSLRGVSATAAARWLEARYGPPPGRRRRIWEVVL
jgi:hypothetical protein